MILIIVPMLGGIFGLIGAVMAGLITYNEYVHHYPTTKEPRRMALQTGLYTFIFFLTLSFALAYVFQMINL